MTRDDGQAMLDAGAALLQVYTGYIYAGPALVAELNRLVPTTIKERIAMTSTVRRSAEPPLSPERGRAVRRASTRTRRSCRPGG